jgi:hypothetical protein
MYSFRGIIALKKVLFENNFGNKKNKKEAE